MSDDSSSLNATLLAPSMVRLLGRVLSGLTGSAISGSQGASTAQVPPAGSLATETLATKPTKYQGKSLLVQAFGSGDLKIAHVFGFTHEGRYTPLQVPALFVVQGEGEMVQEGGKQIDPGRIGLAHLDGTLSFASDLRFWAYDSGDETMRLDVATGSLQQLLIDAEASMADGQERRIDLVGQGSRVVGRLGRGSY
jgi:hypothetical protein